MPNRLDGKPRRKNRRPGRGALLTHEELARKLGEPERAIRTWQQARVLPSVRIGYRTVRFILDDCLKALAKRSVGGRT
jgi:hypothetical protein